MIIWYCNMTEHPSLLAWKMFKMYCIDTSHISDENKKYSRVAEEFDNYFKVQKCNSYYMNMCNSIRETSWPNESVEQFITKVHRLGDSCKLGEMKDLIRDHLVSGRDPRLWPSYHSGYRWNQTSHCMDRAKWLIHQRDAVKEQETLNTLIKEGSMLDVISKKAPRRILHPIKPQPMYATSKLQKAWQG